MSNENKSISNKDININLFYNSKEYSIPKNYIDNIDLLLEEKTLRNFLIKNLNITNNFNNLIQDEIQSSNQKVK